jgi:hypothetical protein
MQQKTVASPSPRVEELEAKRQLVRALMGGTFTMRAAGQTYLPKHPAEGQAVYDVRLQKTFLDNFVSIAIEKATGKLFAREIQVESLPTETERLIENIDRQGRALNPFIMDVAKTAFQDGISYVMADMPKVENVQTLADEKALGVRPYAIHIKPSSILETVSEMIGGVDTLTRVRIKECLSIPDEWGYVSIEQIRVWYRENVVVRWELYRQNEKKEWVLHDEGVTTFKAIYLIPFYTNRVGFMEGEPPFQNIAESNLEHWQWKSEHAHALSMCCFGMYTAAGVPETYVMGVGPAKTHVSTDPQTKWGVLETSGVGVTLAADTLKEIESRIETAPVGLRVENAGKVTATAAALDSEDTNAGLKAVAQGFSDSIELLFQYFAEMMGQDPLHAGEAHVNDDFGQKHGSDAGLVDLSKQRALSDISRRQYSAELKWRGERRPDFDDDLNDEELAAEGPALSSFTNDKNKGAQQ